MVGRTLPGLVIAAILLVVWGFVAVPTLQHAMFADRAVWVTQNDSGWRDGSGPIAWLDTGYFDSSTRGLPGEPGRRLADEYAAADLRVVRCGPEPDASDAVAGEAYGRCNETFWGEVEWMRAVPATAFGDFQAVGAAVELVVAALLLLATFPIVARRRPA